MKKLNILVGCESSGTVRSAFRKAGHNAWSCDILPADDNSEYHLRGNLLHFITNKWEEWDILIAFPPCTYLASSGLHWNKRIPGRSAKTEQALDFVRKIMDAPIDKIAIENPVGCISSRIRKPDQYIQPWQFGEDASKKTGLWLKNLPKLEPTKIIEPGENGRYSNQTPSGQNKLGPSPDRWKERSKTYQGIADAMVQFWGGK